MKILDVMVNTRFALVQGENVDIRNLTIDSRNVVKGSLFFCIKGTKVDGHRFIEQAAEHSAAAIVIEEDQERLPQGVTVLKVESTREAMSYAAANFYQKPAEDLELIGITGTKGKTSSSYFLESVLSEYTKKAGVIGTIGIKVGSERLNINFTTATTPDPIELHYIFNRMREEGAEIVAMEVSSHALALKKIEGIHFKVGIFTNLTHDHLEFHETMENYKKAKAKLFQKCEYAVINVDDPAAEFMMENCTGKILTFGINQQSDLQAKDITYLENGVTYTVTIDEQDETFFVPVRGRFTVYNSLGIIGAALVLGIPVTTIQNGLKNVKTVPGRIESVPNDKGINVIVDYAHSPDSLSNIISAVRDFTKNRVLTVFGCGGDRDTEKRPVMGRIAGELSDYCIITSDNPRTENPEAIIKAIEDGIKETNCGYDAIVDRKEAIYKAIELAKTGDSIIIAGKGHENYQIFADRTIHFDDSEVAVSALEG